MAAPELGPWQPLGLAETVALFRPARFRWWISGGRALELHLGRSWREHDDTDVGVLRADVPGLPTVLAGWDIHVAAAGQLTPWAGDQPPAERQANNLWCRPRPGRPWALDVTVGEGDDAGWVYRRDPQVRRPWPGAVLETADGVPYLAPELQLLFKSKDVRGKDDVDARQVIAALDAERRRRLARLLAPGHPWQLLIAAAE